MAVRGRSCACRAPGQLSPRDPLGALPAPHAPAPERADRRLGASAPDSGSDPCDAQPARRRRWTSLRARDASGRRAPGLAPGLVRRAPSAVLQLGVAERLAAQPRASAADGCGTPLLVAGLRAAASDRVARHSRLSRAGFPHRPVALTRLHLFLPAVLLVLRKRPAALGPLGGQGPEPGGNPDERRPDEHPLRGLCLAPASGARRRGGATASQGRGLPPAIRPGGRNERHRAPSPRGTNRDSGSRAWGRTHGHERGARPLRARHSRLRPSASQAGDGWSPRRRCSLPWPS